MDPGCLFCKIARGEIPVQRLAEDEHALAFPDLRPQAPVHVLVIPKRHLASLAEAGGHWELIGQMHALAVKVAREQHIAEGGFRTVFNTGADAGQTVFHLHLHLLGGRALGWPPG
ncbi:MAG: histidine triad nucleotide-binding protein [Myxococcales bacterium]